MNHSIALLRTIVKHKIGVAKAGRRFGVSWYRILVHDLSKLSPAEFPGYRDRYHAGIEDKEGFDRTWHNHIARNRHHPEFWIQTSRHAMGVPLDMPEMFIREMLADWFGASWAYAGAWPDPKDWPWLRDNLAKITLLSLPERCLGASSGSSRLGPNCINLNCWVPGSGYRQGVRRAASVALSRPLEKDE